MNVNKTERFDVRIRKNIMATSETSVENEKTDQHEAGETARVSGKVQWIATVSRVTLFMHFSDICT